MLNSSGGRTGPSRNRQVGSRGAPSKDVSYGESGTVVEKRQCFCIALAIDSQDTGDLRDLARVDVSSAVEYRFGEQVGSVEYIAINHSSNFSRECRETIRAFCHDEKFVCSHLQRFLLDHCYVMGDQAESQSCNIE